jgi:hypothetical protein
MAEGGLEGAGGTPNVGAGAGEVGRAAGGVPAGAAGGPTASRQGAIAHSGSAGGVTAHSGSAGGVTAHSGSAGGVTARVTQHPAAMLFGPGHLVVYGNPPFRALFGTGCIGLPAAEALLDLPRGAFELMDLVYHEGRPLARWIEVCGATWRLTIAERRDIDAGEVYGIALHLVPRERGASAG